MTERGKRNYSFDLSGDSRARTQDRRRFGARPDPLTVVVFSVLTPFWGLRIVALAAQGGAHASCPTQDQRADLEPSLFRPAFAGHRRACRIACGELANLP